ncbi:hypothetical protein ABPG75_011418 [Micractinium tetrahymenae]
MVATRRRQPAEEKEPPPPAVLPTGSDSDSDDEAPEEVSLATGKQSAVQRRREEAEAKAAARAAAKQKRAAAAERARAAKAEQAAADEEEGEEEEAKQAAEKEEVAGEDVEEDEGDEELDLLPSDVLAALTSKRTKPTAAQARLISEQLRGQATAAPPAAPLQLGDEGAGSRQLVEREAGPVVVRVLGAEQRPAASQSARDFLQQRLQATMVSTRAQTAPRPLALFDALLSDNRSMVDRLLNGSGAAQLAHTGPGGFTTLHAAIVCGRTGLLPALAAAGAPLDVAVECRAWEQPLRELLAKAVQYRRQRASTTLLPGSTPLASAVRFGNQQAVEQLLELGASPTAGSHDETAFAALSHAASLSMAELLLPLGGDCLATPPYETDCWLVKFARGATSDWAALADTLLAKLEAQRAAERGHAALVGHALAALPRRAGAQAAALDVGSLGSALFAAARGGNLAVLRALLDQARAHELAAVAPENGVPLLGAAAASRNPAAMVPLLHRAGVPLTAAALEHAARSLTPEGVQALLALPSRSTFKQAGGMAWPADLASAVLCAAGLKISQCRIQAHGGPQIADSAVQKRHSVERAALGVLETLLAAGCPAAPGLGVGGVRYQWEKGNISHYLLLVARGKAKDWGPASHRRWPPAFRDAARTLLLAAARCSRARTGDQLRTHRRSLLGALPHELLLSILQRAATPVSAWV